MKKLLVFLIPALFALAAFDLHPVSKFPWKQAGLTQEEAAAHLLSRFSFGARPGDVKKVIDQGLENWFNEQLNANLSDDSLDLRLKRYPSLQMTNAEIVETYPRPAKVLRMAMKEGVIDKDSASVNGKKEYRRQLQDYMASKNLKPQAELTRELINQKIIRAVYSRNQLKEVMTDFWFNHFNVSLTKGDDRQFITAYERDAIRPNALGSFESLLLATAHSPAMLTFLDNFRSVADDSNDAPMAKRAAKGAEPKQNKQKRGLNENYAREVMELHTLGVDGGYTQADVTAAARVFTGWTIYPMGEEGGQVAKLIERVGEDKLKQRGFVHDGDFFFASNRHDNTAKTVLGKNFPKNGGYAEGLELIHMLATHPATAHFISAKLATRFVNDHPSQALVDKMASRFLHTGGNIKEVLLAMVESPEFWSKDAVREKTKSPFELAMSAVRGLNADVQAPYQLYNWLTKMGQQIYYYQAPTGFPDRAQYWINSGSLLNRMNFSLALAAQRIPGVRVNLLALNSFHEPESAEAALKTYSNLLLPGRDLTETIKRLQPLLADPELQQKVDAAAGRSAKQEVRTEEDVMTEQQTSGSKTEMKEVNAQANAYTLAQVVGIILGSPEFQRK